LTTAFEQHIRIHPETGEPSLLLGHFVRSFTGFSSADFHDLFSLLQRHITRLENTVRWTWRDGDELQVHGSGLWAGRRQEESPAF
jgi:alpha-ketoglutarate-dependent taurine dioxygenase